MDKFQYAPSKWHTKQIHTKRGINNIDRHSTTEIKEKWIHST